MLLKKGSRGKTVKNLQNDLIDLGFGTYLKSYGADSIFGGATYNAVVAFQKWVGIKIDGIVGKQTITSINNRITKAGEKGTFNFSIREFRCKGTGKMLKNGMDSLLLLRLEKLRYQLGNKPIIINSGYRTKQHNKNVGGTRNSQHLYGKASDIVVKGVSPSKVYREADKIFYNGGVGKYNTFTHVDTRGYKARF